MPRQWRNQIWQSLEEGAGKQCSECVFKYGLFGRKAALNGTLTELRSCVTVEVAVLGFPSLIVLKYGLFGRKAALNGTLTELRSCVKVEVTVLGSPSIVA